MMNEFIIIGITGIVFLGILAQWLGWRFRIPGILLLSLAGLVAGPVTGFLDPEMIFGRSLFPLIALSVAIILFEGGLSLRLKDLKEIKHSVINLVTIGILVTWFTSALGARLILDLDFRLSVLFGAVLVVTGPTVIIPLLNHLRLVSRIGAVARWEGIVNDPIGALISVLVFEILVGGGIGLIPQIAIPGILITLFLGTGLAFAASYLIILSIRKYWIPDHLQNPMILMLVISVFTISNYFQSESGLLAVTAMGIILANQRSISIRHIAEFKENLRVLLISGLFIILIARLRLSDLEQISYSFITFLIFLIILSRPLAVYLSTVRLSFSWKERLFLSFMAPRGVVAASVASIFSIELVRHGYPEAELLVSYTFAVILGTVTVYGLAAPILARSLGLSQSNPQGILIIGAHNWARQLAKCLQTEGFKILLVDTNYANIARAGLMGLKTYYGNILSENIFDKLDLTGIGRLISVTPNEEVNNLAALHFQEFFGRAEVYQLPASGKRTDGEPAEAMHLRGRTLFGKGCGYQFIENHISKGALIKTTEITKSFDFSAYKKHYASLAVPLCLVIPGNEIEMFTTDSQPVPLPGSLLIGLVFEEKESI